ncbi:MAG: glycosyltransferase [Bacteriodetes bacterium]|nr:glycosyltransferase [Bacteroidota bacterium]
MTVFDIDLIIINRNTVELTRNCITSIRNTQGALRVNIIVVDNASTDGSPDILEKEFPDVTIIRSEKNLGYGAAFNVAFAQCSAPYAVISNTDVVYHDNTLQTFCRFMNENTDVGVCGGQQIYPDGRWQRSYGPNPNFFFGFILMLGSKFWYEAFVNRYWKKLNLEQRVKEVGFVDGAVMFLRRTALEQLGGFDPSFLFFAEDGDVCMGMKRNGWKVKFVPQATFTHIRGGTRSFEVLREQHYLSMNMHFRFQLARKYLTPLHEKLWGVTQVWYYAELMLVYKVLGLLTGKQLLHDKSTVCKTLLLVCASELEGKTSTTISLP